MKKAPQDSSASSTSGSGIKPDAPEKATIEVSYTRRKEKNQEEKLKNHTIKTIEYRLPEAEQVCSCCGGALHEMSKQERVEVEYVPR